ncbi:uncharacterized protein LDX57_006676 [Aspergillus melleus]|uniref:uncharacterized protein n=1 Tax=Aspergillus melleus TaxID=138277 RepID=UPI001E8CC8C9|nr:uncharacterized protein LDX57_006676 [Aspergillus melleus]KAH8429005.1 hypothetical protein LDX57_006676 [Aspergillus melleus]
MAHQQKWNMDRRQSKGRSSDEDSYEIVEMPYTRPLAKYNSKMGGSPKRTEEAKMAKSIPLICLDSDEEGVSKFNHQPKKTEASSSHHHEPSLVDAEEENKTPIKDGKCDIDDNEPASLSHFIGQIESLQSQSPRTPRSSKSNNSLKSSSNVGQGSYFTQESSSHPSINPYKHEGDVPGPTEEIGVTETSELHSARILQEEIKKDVSGPTEGVEANETSEPRSRGSLQDEIEDVFSDSANESEVLGFLESLEVLDFEEELRRIEEVLGESSGENDSSGSPAMQHSVGSEELRQIEEALRQPSLSNCMVANPPFQHSASSGQLDEAEEASVELTEELRDAEYPTEPSQHHEESSIPGSPEIEDSMASEGRQDDSYNSSFEPSEEAIIFQKTTPQSDRLAESLDELLQHPQEPAQTSNQEGEETTSRPESPQADEPSDHGIQIPFEPTGDPNWDRRVVEIHRMLQTINMSPSQNFAVLATIIMRRLADMSDAELWDALHAVFGVTTFSDVESSNSQSLNARVFHDGTAQSESVDAESSNTRVFHDVSTQADSSNPQFSDTQGHRDQCTQMKPRNTQVANVKPPVAQPSNVISHHNQVTQIAPAEGTSDVVYTPKVSVVNQSMNLTPLYERLDDDTVVLIMVFFSMVGILNGLTFLWVSLASANRT